MVIPGQFINKASERQTLVNKPIPTAVYSLVPFCFDQLNELNEVRLLFLRIAALQWYIFFQKASFKAYLQKKIINWPCLSEDLVGIQTVQRDTFKHYRNISFQVFCKKKSETVRYSLFLWQTETCQSWHSSPTVLL